MSKGAKNKIAKEPPKCKHRKKELGYMQWHRWAEEQYEKGLVQKQCPLCKLWFFPSEY